MWIDFLVWCVLWFWCILSVLSIGFDGFVDGDVLFTFVRSVRERN